LGHAFACGFIVISLVSCVQIPRRDGIAAADVNAIIRRIKCDLNKIVIEKAYKTFEHEVRPERRQPFLFLRSWAAKVHLTVAIDDSIQINPGASYTAPLHTVGETFTLGIGGNATTQAIRQEDVEFLMSFKDIEADNDKGAMNTALYEFCAPEPGLFLESDLGLKPLIDAALKPVETGVLRPGNNIGPGAGAPVAIPKADWSKIVVEKRTVDPNALTINEIVAHVPRLNGLSQKLIKDLGLSPNIANMTITQMDEQKTPDTDKENAAKVKTLLANSSDATAIETKTQAIINNIVKPRFSIASGSFDGSCMKPVAEFQYEAIAQAANVSAAVIDVDKAAEAAADATKLNDALSKSTTALGKVKDANVLVVKATNDMADKMQRCAKLTMAIDVQRKKDGPPVYDPISTISETINFYVTFSGTVTPTWKLVRVVAPTAGNFLSSSRKDTNTLILTMGRPVAGANGAEASRAMDNQILYSILGQAIPKQ